MNGKGLVLFIGLTTPVPSALFLAFAHAPPNECMHGWQALVVLATVTGFHCVAAQ